MDKEEEERILQFLDETLHDDPVSEENNAADHNPYYSGIEDSDDTDADPDYLPSDVSSDSDIDDMLEHPTAEIPIQETGVDLDTIDETVMDTTDNTVMDTVNETIETVITTYCQDYSPPTDIPQVGIIAVTRPQAARPDSPPVPVALPPNVAPGPPPVPHDPHHIVCPNQRMRGKNGHMWSNIPPQATTRAAARNIIHIRPGPTANARNKTIPLNVFSLFFTDDMKDSIIRHTNSAIRRKQVNYANLTSTVSEITREEFDAFLGVLILTAGQKDNHMPSNELFNPEFCGDRYLAVMSCARFDFLVEAIRFDAYETRNERCRQDRFAPIREVWDMFVASCREKYKPGSYITIDEQLLAFRGRCKFRMYIPNKPAKYGIKIVMICDTSSKFMINAMPYLGKGTTPRNIPQAQFFVKELTQCVYGSNRNVTTDNWFTSVPLATQLLGPPINMTLVGTLRRDKPEIPPEMKEPGDRPIGSSMFCFDGHKTMVSYKTKKKKVVLLLSTTHENPAINPRSKKPEIIECYNATKGAVDSLDQMCNNMSCSRKTRRWPLCVFYGMINIMLVNCYVIYVHNMTAQGARPVSRRDFAKALHCELVEPWLQHRNRITTLPKRLRESIANILKVELPAVQPGPQLAQGRKICAFCPSKKRRMTTHFCRRCAKAMCGEHQGKWCEDCTN